MNRQELQAMIDSTIVPNKKKGITAESLRLVLSEMANATPQGSGNLEVINIYWPLDSEEGFSEDAIEELISAYKSAAPKINEDELRSYLKSILSKNAEAFKRIIETKDDKNILCFLVVAFLEDFIADGLNSMYEETIGIKVYKSVCGGLRLPMACHWQVLDYTEEIEGKEGLQDFQAVRLTYNNIDLSLNPDGSFVVVRPDTEQTSTSNGDIVFVCTGRIDEELTSEQKTHNIEMLNRIKNAEVKPSASIAIPNTYDSGTFTTNYPALETTYMSDPELGDFVYMAVFAGGTIQEVIVNSDGTVEIFAE